MNYKLTLLTSLNSFSIVAQPLPAGNFVESNTLLKVTVELAYPLATLEDIAAKKSLPSTVEVSSSNR